MLQVTDSLEKRHKASQFNDLIPNETVESLHKHILLRSADCVIWWVPHVDPFVFISLHFWLALILLSLDIGQGPRTAGPPTY